VKPSKQADRVIAAACVQFDVRRNEVEANLAAATAGLTAAAAAGARLCVLPELWSTSFAATFTDNLAAAAAAAETRLGEFSRQHDLVVVGSGLEAAEGRFFNTARVHDRGTEVGRYRKIHLFSPNMEHRRFAAGDSPLVVDTSVGRLGVMVCYDLRFPELTRIYYHRGTEILAVPAQWPEARSQHWRSLLRARAIENQCFVVGSNRTGQEPSLKNNTMLVFTGDGRIVDPTGEVLVAGTGEAGAITASMEIKKVATMRRIVPVGRDQRPSLYGRLWEETLRQMASRSREREGVPRANPAPRQPPA
jgi:predicted amidohydrolase